MNSKTLLLVAVCSGAALPAAAQNQVVNTGFVTDLSGWTVLANPAFATAHDTSQSYHTPGSLRVSTPGATAVPFVVVRQCLPVTPGQVVDFGVKARFEDGHAADLRGQASVSWFTDAGCTAGFLSGVSTSTTGPAPNAWNGLHANDLVVPAGRNSVLFQLVIGVVAGEGVAWFDDAYFGPDPLVPVELIGATVE